MKISVLVDNNPGGHTAAEHGLSYLLEHEGIKLLFDTGQSDLFLKNATSMGINLTDIDVIVISHGHFDHGNGLQYLAGAKLVCHPGCFVKRYRKADYLYIGLKNSKEELEGKFKMVMSSMPYHISDKIIFLGEIPRITDFESKSTSFILDDGIPDFVVDDSAIAIMLDEGLFIVTGCGHAGVVNTLEYARKVTGIDKLYGIMGGFHLKNIDRQTKETIGYLKNNALKYIFPSHCTALPALSEFYKVFKINVVKTGDVLNF